MRQTIAHRHSNKGFTLIELLAAVTIFALFSVMAYGGLSAVLKARTRVTESLGRTAEFQKALFRLQSDIEEARDRPIRDEFGDNQPAFFVTDESLVEFTRGGWRNPRLQPRSSFERVAYGVKDKKLMRYSWATLDRAQGGQIIELPLLDHVKSLTWRFMDSNHQWQTSWPPRNVTIGSAGVGLPIVVELRLETDDWGEIRYLFRIISAPPVPNASP